MQVPLGGRRPSHAANRDDSVAVLVVEQVPTPAGSSCAGMAKGGDVLGGWRVRQRR